MPKKTTLVSSSGEPVGMPLLDPDAREKHLIGLATDLAEQKLRDGTASSQLILHYLQLATAKERKELAIMDRQMTLLDAKAKAYESAAKDDVGYEMVIAALKRYGGLNESGQDTNVFRAD